MGRACPTETWDAAGSGHELLGDETIKATLVVAAEWRLLATASLQIHPDAPECGCVRWVGTEQVIGLPRANDPYRKRMTLS